MLISSKVTKQAFARPFQRETCVYVCVWARRSENSTKVPLLFWDNLERLAPKSVKILPDRPWPV